MGESTAVARDGSRKDILALRELDRRATVRSGMNRN